MTEELKTYDVYAKVRFGVKAKSIEHARVIVENGVSYSVRLGIPLETEVHVLGEVKSRPVFDQEDFE